MTLFHLMAITTKKFRLNVQISKKIPDPFHVFESKRVNLLSGNLKIPVVFYAKVV